MSNSSRGRIFLTGATGEVGAQVLKLLQDAGAPVRVMLRRQKQVDEYIKRGVDAVHCSLDDTVPELTKHMSGCDTLYLLTAAVPDQLQHNITAIDAAVAADVQWIVRISAGDAREEGNVPWVRAHAVADRYLESEAKQHQLSWTVLSPSGFMQNILSEAPAIKNGFLPQTSGNGRVGWIDTYDVAAASASVLLSTPAEHHTQTYILTGPALISIPTMADTLTQVLNHRVRYLHLPGPLFGLLLRATGLDAWMANGLVAQFVEIVRPDLEGIEVSDAVEKLTGKKPRSFEDFARANRSLLAGGRDLGPWIVAGVVAAVGIGTVAGMRVIGAKR